MCVFAASNHKQEEHKSVQELIHIVHSFDRMDRGNGKKRRQEDKKRQLLTGKDVQHLIIVPNKASKRQAG